MNYKLYKITRITGIAVLSAFIFSFLHSEIGFLHFENESYHDSHDHCLIVNGTTTRDTKLVSADFLKLKENSLFVPKNITGQAQYTAVYISETSLLHNANKNNKLYLNNRTLLI